MSTGRLSDEILVARVASGDRTALESLYDYHAAAVLGISLKIIGDRAAAEDVLQETFWRVWQSAVTYRSQRGSFTGWLFRIARNLAIDAYRRRSVRPQTIIETVDANVSVTKVVGFGKLKKGQASCKMVIEEIAITRSLSCQLWC